MLCLGEILQLGKNKCIYQENTIKFVFVSPNIRIAVHKLLTRNVSNTKITKFRRN